MSYAIIRNEKYKRDNLKGIYRHNERKNTNYSNKNIDKTRTYLNYAIKQSNNSYEKEFDRLKEQNNLKGQIKDVSNIVCEYIITSDIDFFRNIGLEETKRYFQESYNFVCEYKGLGEENILSANIHLDEETPHMHLTFIPVVSSIDKKGNEIRKVACSEFWKERDSYRILQDNYYNYITSKGFDLQRGQPSETKHISMEDYKKATNFHKVKDLTDIQIKQPSIKDISQIKKITIDRDTKIEDEIITPLKAQNSILKEQNIKLVKELTKVENIVNKADMCVLENKELNKKNRELKLENKTLRKENHKLYDILDTAKDIILTICRWVARKLNLTIDRTIDTIEIENNICIEPSEQIQKQKYEKELEQEIEM
ncbi:MAG: MobV family relaxase [Clostridia bacterium]|nr:MobV family relaxase [Clostridia bacterium]